MGRFIHEISNSTDLAMIPTRITSSPLILEGLPIELIAMVVEVSDLSKVDLTQLRLTCKAFHPWATRRLATDHLSRIRISNMKKDLEVLTEISDHPHIGPYVRSVQFDYLQHEFVEWPRCMHSAQSQFSFEPEAQSSSQDKHFHRCRNSCPESGDMETIETLTRAFTRVKSSGHALSLAATDWNGSSILSQHQKVSDHPLCRHHAHAYRLYHGIRALLQAVDQSGVRIDGLSLYCRYPNMFNPKEEKVVPAKYTRIYSELKTLNLRVSLMRLYPFLEQQLLPKVDHLETIYLDSFDTSTPLRGFISLQEVRVGQKVLDSISSDSLANVTLHGVFVSVEVLLHFLRRHRMTLKCLAIRHCALLNGSWYDILSWSHDSIADLERLELSYLYVLRIDRPGHHRPYEAIRDETVRACLFAEGRRAVQSELDSIIIERQNLSKTG